jgi:hypothetical protein
MTAGLLERPAPPAATVALRALAALEAKRYVRSPLFLIGTALLLFSTVVTTGDLLKNAPADDPGDLVFFPASTLGLLGVLVGYQLARSVEASGEAFGAGPSDGVRRTAALCLACLVPGGVALLWAGSIAVAVAVQGIPLSAAISPAERAAILLSGVVCAVGGPLFGVLVARWAHFPGAGLIAVLVLAGWTLLATVSLALPPSRSGTLLHLSAPMTVWVSASGPRAPAWVAGGSPGWYLGYLILLCSLAVTAASLPGTAGPRRRRILRLLGLLAVVTIGCLALAVLPDPARIPL